MSLIHRPIDLNALQLPTELPCALALFAPLAALPWSMLLDSAGEGAAAPHPDAGYDILVADPIATLVTRGEETQVTHQGQSQYRFEDPLELLAQTQQALLGPLDRDGSQLPFTGGAMGHFSYDLGRRFERLPQQAEDDIALPEMAVGLYDWALLVDRRKQGQADAVSLLVRGDEAQWQARWQWLQQQRVTEAEPFQRQGQWQHQLTEAQYLERFDRVQAYLRSGDCYQINLTQRFSSAYQGDEWQAYLALRCENAAPFSAFIRLPEAALLSLSPERFIQVKGRQVQTKPIKGTRPRHADPAKDVEAARALARSDKDRAENLMIVDLLRNDLGRMAAPGSVQVPHLFAIESFPAVHHLVSTVTSELAEGASALDLLRAAFPGGSITGAPKIRAMEIIEELEPHRRSLYCGSIGYLSQNGTMDTSITIRTLVAKSGWIHCWAGGGIVADSVGTAEYQECFDKLSRILPLL
ncbi:aminodeoxychorismate synthase component I [Ferrimonas marina]|uniref:aminodeoxychorismate synthase n=1 Tax=Ferrimonas marina TaxID=299255 RepID=A0A1M5NRT2_9GAMM|nr:aminodeoxychorismate synthase component I [Ferrimonas marina]SHG92155.1 para-aminobenzoate synthetase component 1 [Ferrimonas marina]